MSEDNKAIPPLLLERECDGDWCKRTKEEKDAAFYQRLTEGTKMHAGCGVRFQWYWGAGCCCPNCGVLYNVTGDDLKSGRFAVREEPGGKS